MILWCDGGHAARENMRRDRLLLERLEAAHDGDAGAEPVLRLFRFTPPGITLGHAQEPARTLDLERCAAARVQWAVRPTGGRAIFHDDEWTYALAARLDDPEWGGGLHESYARVSRLVQASLVTLGIPAKLAISRSHRGRGEGGEGLPHDPTRPACFASTARHEIELDGKKLVGSAQRRTAAALLQQGSVLLGDSHVRLADYLRVRGAAREAARRSLGVNAAPGGAHLGCDRGLERWAAAIAHVVGPSIRMVFGESGAGLLTHTKPAPYTACRVSDRVAMTPEVG